MSIFKILNRFTGDVMFECDLAPRVNRGRAINLALEAVVDLSAADLREGDWGGANLRYADLRRATLEWTNCKGADITGADFRSAMVYGAEFTPGALKTAFQPNSGKGIKCDD